jgi:hypothetical protein
VIHDTSAALDFLIGHTKRWRSDWYVQVVAIEAKRDKEHHPQIDARCVHPSEIDTLHEWIEQRQGTRNLYFCVNPLRHNKGKKASKTDIAALACLHVDFDPRKGFPLENERVRMRRVIDTITPPPSELVNSGNGLGGFWLLTEPAPLDDNIEALESYSKQLAQAVGGDACHNIERVMRLPGTINQPGYTKIAEGRVAVPATLLYQNDTAYALDDFKHLSPIVIAEVDQLIDDAALNERLKFAAFDPDYSKLMRGEALPWMKDVTRSGFDFAFASVLVRLNFTDGEITALLIGYEHGKARERANPDRYIADILKKVRAEKETEEDEPLVFVGPERARIGDLTIEPMAHEFIVDGLIPVCNGVFVSPGGVGKTTLTLREEIHIILERDIWQRKVLRPGPALFITGEDSKEDMAWRLHKLTRAMKLSPEELRRVRENTFIEDVSGRVTRFVKQGRNGNLEFTRAVEQIIEQYRGAGLSIVNIDPMVFFGPGERFVNDGEAVMAQAARHISNELKAHVRFIHHTGKAVARDKTVDQYAGRNGSALADNSRQVMQLVEGEDKNTPLPKAARDLVNLGWQVMAMWFHKVSYGPKPKAPVILLRNAWEFMEFAPEAPNSELSRAEDMETLRKYIRKELLAGRYPTLWTLKTSSTEIGLPQRRVAQLVEGGLQTGEFIERALPADKCKGRRTSFIEIGRGPEEDTQRFFGGGESD